ncbi:MAG: sigma 54-interacting transcriptional regulator [Thermodesulfobacteriota bacterium]
MDSAVILYGEIGTGKELFARALYANSLRVGRPFVAIDCSALSPGILESELFGHAKGAFYRGRGGQVRDLRNGPGRDPFPG